MEYFCAEFVHLLLVVVTVKSFVVGSVGVAVDDVNAADIAVAGLPAATVRESIVDVVACSGGIGVVGAVVTVEMIGVDDVGIVVINADATDVADVADELSAAGATFVDTAENIAADDIVVVVVAKLAVVGQFVVALVR